MELRVLEYFLAVAREQNISRAAEFLHLTQPTLSRQLRDLEDEFGKQLLIRGKRKVTLTEDGALFRKMAEEIVSLAKRAETEMKHSSQVLAGDIYIGTGESIAIQNIIRIADGIQKKHQDVHFHFTSGDSTDLVDRLDKGLFDFCVLYGEVDQTKYEYIELPFKEEWAALMSKNAPLAKKEEIETRELWNVPLILARHSMNSPSFFKWLGKEPEELNITNTSNLVYTAMLMAEAEMGYALTLNHLVNTQGTNLCYKPVVPRLTLNLSLVWKKYRTQSKAAKKFIEALERYVIEKR